MDIEKQFNLIAEEYDKNRRKFILCFDEFYIGATDFLAANIDKPTKVLDLGAGTGLLSSFWFRHYPNAEYVLVDIAEEMLNVARRRFDGVKNVSYSVTDYSEKLPDGVFDAVISALSVHHLDDLQKEKLFKRVYDKLPKGGLFVNYDQFCADDGKINGWFNSYWENGLLNSGLTDKDIELWKERRKLDKECSAEQETAMLLNAGFQTVKCVYSCQKFSVIVAVK